MDKKYVWAVEDIYESVSEWEKDFSKAKSMTDFSEFRGKLGGKKAFYDCMKKEEAAGRIIEKLGVYAMMNHDGDTKNSQFDALLSRVNSLSTTFGAETAFITPELLSLPQKTIEDYIKDPELSDYDYSLKCLLKEKEHILSENEERLLTESGEAMSSFKDIFTKTDNADLPFPEFTFKGKDYKITHGGYSVAMQDKDRELRELAFKKYYGAYISLINVISATYYGNVKKDVFYAKARKYDSCLASALYNEDVPAEVYRKLISSVNDALPALHDYIAEKKKALGYPEMHMYDMYMPIVPDKDLKLEYEEAYDLVVKGLSVLGEEYVGLLEKARKERWLDVYETDGKKSGAYSVAVYDTHPFVLLNYQKTTHDVFTIAHEMGHSIHSYFSNKNRPYAKADYKIFVAEVASTVNEVLLLKYLLRNAEDKALKKYLLSYLMEMIRTTLFRQTQFSEFEEFAHGSVEKGEPLTKDDMCEKYLELNKKYYGDAVVSDDEIKYEWARIPHFYRAFYVYKYATGIISALAIAERITTEGRPAVEDYFRFLSSGNSDGPVELLKIAGVDLTSEKPYKSAFKSFENALEEFKKL